jgi:uncharacterized protein (DUF2235 family)
MRALKSLGGRQRKHYEKGVGSRAWEALAGGIYGYGLDKRILGSYRFLRDCFADRRFEHEDNRVFIIGFSRGAYTARRLAGLIAHSGIPRKAADTELGWETYQNQDAVSARKLKRDGRFFDIQVEMLGVWDTVKATNDPDYHDRKLPTNVVAGYHAMAIDERRKSFPILRWNKDPRALETWFAGAHSDVGGGYARPGLSDLTLKWMMYRALKNHGLHFNKSYMDEHVKPRPKGKVHDSFTGIWQPMGARVRKIRKTDFVHQDVAKQLEKPGYRPENLPANPKYWPPAEG